MGRWVILIIGKSKAIRIKGRLYERLGVVVNPHFVRLGDSSSTLMIFRMESILPIV